MIKLNEEQNSQLVKDGLNGSELRPFAYSGSWWLPEAVLLDDDYIEQREFLLSLPLVELEIKDDSEL